jgi:hypothetical protein
VRPEDIFTGFQDHARFCRECLTIPNLEGRVVPMELGPAQLRLNEAIQKQRAQGKPVRIIFLKARRVQISTGTAAQFFHHTPFRSGQHTAVIAHDESTAINLHKFYTHFTRNYKPFGGVIGLPRLRKSSEGLLEWENDSSIQIATARNVNFGRSRNLRRVQFDEFAFYTDAAKLMTSVMAAVPKDPDTMVIIPSTANGVGNEFHRLWIRATDPTIESEWLGVFFAWWEHPLNAMPLTERPEKFQSSLTHEELELKAKYNLTLEQLAWRRWVIENDFGGDAAKFRQEHPSCPEEAFIASGRLRFDVHAINRMPVERNAPQGGIEVIDVGPEKRIAFVTREHGELTMFRKPIAGHAYIIGADTAEGIDANEGQGEADPDYSVAKVRDRDTGEECAVLRARLAPSAFGQYLYWLGVYFHWAGIVVEVNGIGIATVDALLRQGYPPQLLYHRRKQPDQDPGERADLIGWKTTTVTRQQLLGMLDTALREQSIIIHDPVTIQELMTFVIGPNGKAQAQRGCHDDCVIAEALTLPGIIEMPRWREQKRALALERYGARGEEEARGTRRKFL